MHNVVDQSMIGVVAAINATTRTVIFQQPLSDAVAQAFGLALIQLAMDFATNAVAMYYESWAGVPVIEVWALERWPHMFVTALLFCFA